MLNLKKLNLKTGTVIDPRTNEPLNVPYRHTMLEALHPGARLGILEVSQLANDRRRMINLLGKEYKGLTLDFATGSRKRGSFIATDSRIGQRYWKTPEQAVAYGSNLLTTCSETPQQQALTVLVVEDGRYQTADCHAKIRPALLPLFGTQERAIQFRLAAGLYLAKGTAAPGEDDQLADLIIPLSAFKSSRKPPLGAHLWQATWGNVFFSQRRRTKVSYQVLQWFSFGAIMADCETHIETEIARLQLASKSPKAASQLVRPDTDVEFTLLDVIKADVHDQLHSHPWIVNGLARMLRQRWLHLATGAGLTATGLMGLPDDTLPDNTVASPDLKQGLVIAFRYPIRNWSDIRLMDVVFDRDCPPGAVLMNTATAASMAGDFDGDYFNFMDAAEYPTMASEVREWHVTREAPDIPKATTRKASHWRNLARVAYESMNCPLGWVTNLITKANAIGELSLCNRLAIESQVAVDGLKFAVKNDWRLLKECQKALPKLAWLRDLKDNATFTSHAMRGGSDTIGRLIAHVAPNWTAPNLLARPLEEYQYLMPKPAESQKLGDYAFDAYVRYGRAVAGLMEIDDDDERKRELSHLIRETRKWANGLNNPEQVALHMWQIAHRHRDDDTRATGSICFHAFAPLICDRLRSPAVAPEVFTVVGLQHNAYHTPQALDGLNGLTAVLTVTDTKLNNRIRSMVHLNGRALGIVSSETPVMPGFYPRQLLWNGNVTPTSLGSVYASAP